MAKSKSVPATAGQVLRAALERKRANARGYSIRALARDLGLSPGFVSKILNDQKPIPLRHVHEFARRLDLDEAAVKNLEILVGGVSPGFPTGADADVEAGDSDSSAFLKPDFSYHCASPAHYRVLEKWYTLAILDMVSCIDFSDDPALIARRLGISRADAARTLTQLLEKGLLERVGGKLRKAEGKLRFPSRNARKDIRDYYQQILAKAVQCMNENTSETEFDQRTIQGLVVAAHPNNMEKARSILTDAIYRAAEVLAEGPCTEVYSLNVVAFPLTRRPSD